MKLFHTIAILFPFISFGQIPSFWANEKIEVKQGEKAQVLMGAQALYAGNWDDLAQPIFWKQIMQLSPDSCLLNVSSTRQVVGKTSLKQWNAQTELRKEQIRDSIRQQYGLDSTTRIFVTTGKNDFYRFIDVYPTIARGVEVFENEGVDPWYAQAILLIESPGQLKKSSTGAYGAFQLMPSVARAMGLTVNNTIDERKDFDKSAMGSARLIKRVCIPEAKKILNNHKISYNESDLWFRLFVLHVYHAGAINVRAVVDKIDPIEGNQELILKMWHNSAAGFGNNSQNYTQLALASQIILNEMITNGSIHKNTEIDSSAVKTTENPFTKQD